MRIPSFPLKPLCSALIVASLLAACGGGSGGGSPATSPNTDQPPLGNPPPSQEPPAPGGNPPPTGTPGDAPPPASVPDSSQMTMSCVDGTSYQCSGASIIRVDNGVALTGAGVQTYGRSTSDLANPIVDSTTANGFTLASGGIAEIRISKDSSGAVSKPALLLRNFGITWDGTVERPPIVEVFLATRGRTVLDGSGRFVPATLPDSSNLNFFDYADRGVAGTQANYANNRYFPREATNPPRCPAGAAKCENAEMSGPFEFHRGNWNSGGRTPDWASGGRLHGDGDVHAGDGKPNGDGTRTILPGGDGKDVPFPGSKGYRSLDNWSLQYSNLSVWVSTDTAQIHEWGGVNEHNTNRRGIVAFGDVTAPAAVPATGSATYSGIAYGWYASDPSGDPSVFWAAATATVNFETRAVVVAIENPRTYNDAQTPLPAVSLIASAKMGGAGSNVANYLTGPVDNGSLKGGLSGRLFGPGAGGPAEIAGTFSLSNSSNGQSAVAGFIARKQ